MPDPDQTSLPRLYSGPLSMYGAKAEIAALEKGILHERIMVSFDNARGYAPKHPEVLRINPKAQVPVYVDSEVELFDSTQLFEYFEDSHPLPRLWPESVAARAQARQIELMADEVFFPHVIRLFGLQEDRDSEPARQAYQAIAAFYQTLEDRIGPGPYLCGTFSYADIGVFMAQVFADRMGGPITAVTPHLLAWRGRMSQRPCVIKVITEMVAYLRAMNRFMPSWMAGAFGAAQMT